MGNEVGDRKYVTVDWDGAAAAAAKVASVAILVYGAPVLRVMRQSSGCQETKHQLDSLVARTAFSTPLSLFLTIDYTSSENSFPYYLSDPGRRESPQQINVIRHFCYCQEAGGR